MRKKRPDGRVVKTVPPIQKIMPYIMKTRTDSMNMYDDVFDCEVWDSYIKEKEAEGIKMSYMHILIAGVVRMIALRPQLNRFIMNGRVYTRHKIYVSFVVHPKLCDGDTETTIKLEFEGTETIQEIAETINRRVKEETTDRQGENGTDEVDIEILGSIYIGFLAGAEGEQNGSAEQIAQNSENHRTDQQQGKGCTQDLAGLFFVAGAPFHREQGDTAHTKKCCESHDQCDNGKSKSHTGQCKTVAPFHMSDIDAIHHIIQKLYQLCDGQRNCLCDDAPPDGSDRKIHIVLR